MTAEIDQTYNSENLNILLTPAEVLDQAQAQRQYWRDLLEKDNPVEQIPISPNYKSEVMSRFDLRRAADFSEQTFHQMEANAQSLVAAISLAPQRIVESVKQLTLEDVKHFAIGYLKSQNPWNLKTQGWRYRGAAVVGTAARLSLNLSGVGLIPFWGGAIKYGISAGGSLTFYKLGEIDIQNYIKKIEKDPSIDEAEKQRQIEDFRKNKMHQVASIKRGLSWGLGFGALATEAVWEHGGSELAANALQQAQMIAEGAQHTDWSQITDNIGKTTNNIGQAKDQLLSRFDHNQVAEPTLVAGPTAVATAQIVTPEITSQADVTVEGYQVVSMNFPKAEGQIGDQIVSLRGKVQAILYGDHYKIGDVNKDGVIKFDQHNVDQLRAVDAEIPNQPDNEDMIRAGMNYEMHLNPTLKAEGAFTDANGQITGEILQGYDADGNIVNYHTISDQDWVKFYDSGEWRNYVTQPDTNVQAVTSLEQPYQWKEFHFDPNKADSEFSKPEWTSTKLGIESTYLEPGEVHSASGLAQAEEAQSYYHIRDAGGNFDATNPTYVDRFVQATADDPLHQAREDIIKAQIEADAPNAFVKTIDPVDGHKVATDLIAGVQPDGSPTHLALFGDYHQLATTLVNENPHSAAYDGADAIVHLDPHELVGNVSYVYNGEQVYSIYDLADALIKKYDLNLSDEQRQLLVTWLQENQPEAYFADPDKTLLRFTGAYSGDNYSDIVPRVDIIKRILGSIRHAA